MTDQKIPFLIETALLTHGLTGISEEELVKVFPQDAPYLVWINEGVIIVGGFQEYLSLRRRYKEVARFNIATYEEAMEKKISGALTASAAMAAAAKLKVPLVVTSGMGGLYEAGDEDCHDLAALNTLPVALLAASPKDVFDIGRTIGWLKAHQIPISGYGTGVCDGFIFNNHQETALDGLFDNRLSGKGEVILNPLSREKRLANSVWLKTAYEKGKEIEKAGGLFHPAVNQALDRLSDGLSGRLQLKALIANIALAKRLLLY